MAVLERWTYPLPASAFEYVWASDEQNVVELMSQLSLLRPGHTASHSPLSCSWNPVTMSCGSLDHMQRGCVAVSPGTPVRPAAHSQHQSPDV